MTYPTKEQKEEILTCVKVASECDGLLMSEPTVQNLCRHVKALLAEVESLRMDVDERAKQKSEFFEEIKRLKGDNRGANIIIGNRDAQIDRADYELRQARLQRDTALEQRIAIEKRLGKYELNLNGKVQT